MWGFYRSTMTTSSSKRLNGCGILLTRELTLTMWTTFVGSCSPSYRILTAVIISPSARLILPLNLLMFACKLSWIITWVPQVTWKIRGICIIFSLKYYRWHIDARMILFLHDILLSMLPVSCTTCCHDSGIDKLVIECIEVSEDIQWDLVAICLSIIPVTVSPPWNIYKTSGLHIF